jgi:hypothetical protein
MFLVSLFHDRDAREPRATRGYAAVFALGVLTLLGATATLGGCTTGQKCEPLTRCGGDMLAGSTVIEGVTQTEWVAVDAAACMDDVQLPIQPVSLAQQPSRTTTKKAATPATVDWCSNLSLKPDGSLRYQPFFPIIPLKNAHLKVYPDGHYDAHFLAGAPQHMAFSEACRTAQGINFSCAELGRHIKEAIAAESNVTNTRCYDDGEGGCTCDYYLRLFTSQPGSWGASDGVATFYDESGANLPPAPADYCVKGDKIEMTGHNGLQLFGRPNLRTLELQRASCSDGVQDGLEDGVDCCRACRACAADETAPDCCGENDAACAKICQNTCGTCSDGVKSDDEEGVDCGGSCPDFCACFDGIQNPWEEGVDCGGTCSLLCTCKNGKQDANESGVDCGGDCQGAYSAKDAVPCP